MNKKLALTILIAASGLAAGLFVFGGNSQANRATQTAARTSNTNVSASLGETVIQWRGTDRSGIFHEPNLRTSWNNNQPQLLWHFDGLGDGHSSPAIANGKIFVTGMTDGRGILYVFDQNGRLLNQVEYGAEWTRNYDGTRGTITPHNGKLYFISGQGVIYCFDQTTLNLIWSRNLLQEFNASNIRWGIAESPLIVGDKVIATPGGEQHNVVALNKNTGELIWSTPAMGDRSAYCSPIFISSQSVPLIVQKTGRHVIGIHADTGEMLWSHRNTNRWQIQANSPLYSNGMILVSSNYGAGATMLRLTNGGRGVEEVWTLSALNNSIGGLVKVGNYIFASTGGRNRTWFCVNWYTGEIMWQERGLDRGVVIANDGMLYMYTQRGEMALARATPEGFNIVGRFPITLGTDRHYAHPILYNGMLLVRRGNTLMAFDVRE